MSLCYKQFPVSFPLVLEVIFVVMKMIYLYVFICIRALRDASCLEQSYIGCYCVVGSEIFDLSCSVLLKKM